MQACAFFLPVLGVLGGSRKLIPSAGEFTSTVVNLSARIRVIRGSRSDRLYPTCRSGGLLTMATAFVAERGRFPLDTSGDDHVVCTAPSVRVAGAGLIFAVSPRERTQVDREHLLAAVRELSGRVTGDLERLRYSYSFRTERFGSVSGMMSGIQIGGKPYYTLMGGKGTCLLTEQELDAHGRAVPVRTIDLRGDKTLETENFGRITFSKKKLKLTIHEQLPRFLAFLEQQTDQHITKMLEEAPLGPLGLVRALDKGEGLGEQWIGEQFHGLGLDAARELVACYAEPRNLPLRDLIAHVFKTMFRPAEVCPIVEQALGLETRPQRRRLYETLLAQLQ
ncbi:MAG: hypothetical protein ACM3U2_17675 [Deltaproteobacteria bacterium]